MSTRSAGNAKSGDDRSWWSWDASIFKNVAITERVKTEFRFEGFNLTNTLQFQNPDGRFGAPSGSGWSNGNFGKVTNIRFSSERQFQFALRVTL